MFQWYRTYERGYETSGSPLRFMLRRSSVVECASVLHGTCLQSVEFFFIRQYVQPCLSKKYTGQCILFYDLILLFNCKFNEAQRAKSSTAGNQLQLKI